MEPDNDLDSSPAAGYMGLKLSAGGACGVALIKMAVKTASPKRYNLKDECEFRLEAASSGGRWRRPQVLA